MSADTSWIDALEIRESTRAGMIEAGLWGPEDLNPEGCDRFRRIPNCGLKMVREIAAAANAPWFAEGCRPITSMGLPHRPTRKRIPIDERMVTALESIAASLAKLAR